MVSTGGLETYHVFSEHMFKKIDTDKLAPMLVGFFVSSDLRVKSVSAMDHHALALTEDGHVFTWGYRGMGALGHSTS